MNIYLASIALCACAFGLGACDRTPTPPSPTAVGTPASADSVATVGPATDPSLPSAESVLSQANTTKGDPTPVRTDGTRNLKQDASATPAPGQNNDHSAPLAPARPASSPLK